MNYFRKKNLFSKLLKRGGVFAFNSLESDFFIIHKQKKNEHMYRF